MPNALTKKVGPLPTWAWVGLGVLFVGMVIYFRRSQAESDSSYVSVSSDGEQIGGQLPGSEEFTYLSSGGGPNYAGAEYDTGVPVGYPPDFFSSLLEGLIPSGYSPSPVIYEGPTSPYMTQPEVGAQTTAVQTTVAAPTKQTSFRWDGVTYYSGDLQKFRNYLKSKGLSYSTWAANHPKAAMDVFGTMK